LRQETRGKSRSRVKVLTPWTRSRAKSVNLQGQIRQFARQKRQAADKSVNRAANVSGNAKKRQARSKSGADAAIIAECRETTRSREIPQDPVSRNSPAEIPQ